MKEISSGKQSYNLFLNGMCTSWRKKIQLLFWLLFGANLIGVYRVILRSFTRKRAIYLFRLSVVMALPDRSSACLRFFSYNEEKPRNERSVLSVSLGRVLIRNGTTLGHPR